MTMMMMNISRREKAILTAGIVFLVVFFGYRLLVAPVFEKQEVLQRGVLEKKALIDQLAPMVSRYLSVTGQMNEKNRGLVSRSSGFSLFSFIDQQAEQSGVKENVAYMKPLTKNSPDAGGYSTAVVKIKLNEVYLKELMDFIFRIESSPNSVTISSLSLNRSGKTNKVLDVVMETQTPIKKAGG